MKKIHVGFLLSYDYEKLKNAIPPVYDEADKIFIACDENFNTWSGNKFSVDSSFFDWLKRIDTNNKIEFYYDNFYIPNLTPIQNDTRERHLLSQKMGIGNWLVQIDSDEYVIDFKSYVNELKKRNHLLDNPKKNPVQIAAYHIDIYKYLEDGLLYVTNTCKVLLATNYPNYKYARQTKEQIIYVNTFVLHESLSRSEEELTNKINNWGHKDELNTTFLDKWKRANKDNYKEIKDVFYLDASQWHELEYLPTKDFKEINNYFTKENKLHFTKFYLLKKNFGQWFKNLDFIKRKKGREFESYF